MKRSPLKRKARLKPVSDRRAKENAVYRKVRKEYLAAHPYCEICLAEHRIECLKKAEVHGVNRATEIHHRKGRGKYLNDVKFFLAVCRKCHNAVGDNPKWAESRGYLLKDRNQRTINP